MSAEGYRIRRLDQSTEIISTPASSKVEPFPTKSWNESLPIAVEGRPLPRPESDKVESKSLTRFYPPLLFLSTLLTGVFLYLYLSKPVIVQAEGSASSPEESVPAVVAPTETILAEETLEELSPFPAAEMLTSNHLPGFSPLESEEETLEPLRATTLSVEQIVEVPSLDDELEELTVSLSVFYPENMLAWSEDSILEAQNLAADIEEHLEKVREVQANSIKLLEDWNRIVSQSTPGAVLEQNEALGSVE